MMQKIRNQRKSKRGFTLIELLVVLGVIAVISAVVIFGLMGATEDKNVTATMTTIKNISDATTKYKFHTGLLPTALKDLWEAPSGVNGWKGPYLKPTNTNIWGGTFSTPYIITEGTARWVAVDITNVPAEQAKMIDEKMDNIVDASIGLIRVKGSSSPTWATSGVVVVEARVSSAN